MHLINFVLCVNLQAGNREIQGVMSSMDMQSAQMRQRVVSLQALLAGLLETTQGLQVTQIAARANK